METHLEIIIFTPCESTINTTLTKLQEGFGDLLTIERCETYQMLSEALQSTKNHRPILITVIERSIDVWSLHLFLGNRDDINLLIVSKNLDNETLALLRLLRPRFIFQNTDISELEEILRKALYHYTLFPYDH